MSRFSSTYRDNGTRSRSANADRRRRERDVQTVYTIPSAGPLPNGLGSLASLQKWFVRSLAFILFGYAVIGRGFAYLGLNPLFVGELVLGLGLLAMFSSGHLGQVLKTSTARWLALFIGWSALMTLPYLPVHGMMALRDGVLWGYSLFGLIVAAVIMAAPQAMRWMLMKYRVFALAFLCTAWAMWTLSSMELLKWIVVPGTDIPLFYIKGGDQLVHLAAIAAFVSVGMSRHRMLMVVGILFNFAFLLTSKRAGMVAFALAFGFLVLMNPPRLKLGGIVYAGVLSVTLLLLINPRIDLGGDREISVEQMTDNVVSTFDQSGSTKLDETKSWRLDWWTKIINYSMTPRYVLTGKGYGINLATDDGFQVREDDALRSPHNAHLNVLARSGFPGFILWTLVHATWFFSMLGAARSAKRRKMYNWHGLFSFLLCYWIGLMTNASFDVYLEGPMGGIWLWSVIGFGVAARYHFDRNPAMLEDAVHASVSSGATSSPHSSRSPAVAGASPSRTQRNRDITRYPVAHSRAPIRHYPEESR